MLRKFGALAAALTLAACATVASTVGFPAADADDDDLLSVAEFREFFDDTDAYERFDDNDDGMLSRTEYTEAVDSPYEADTYWHGLNIDHNDTLSRDEFIDGWFKMFDADKSNSLSRAEFENAIESLEVEL